VLLISFTFITELDWIWKYLEPWEGMRQVVMEDENLPNSDEVLPNSDQ